MFILYRRQLVGRDENILSRVDVFGGYFEEKKSNIYRRYPCGSHDARGFSTFVGG